MRKKLLKASIGVFLSTLSLAFGFTLVGCAKTPTVEDKEPSLEYALVEDGYAVVGLGTYEEGILNIPSTYNDKPVTTIGAKAFYGEIEIGIVNVPDSVTKIEAQAFSGCPNITEVSIGKNVTEIGKGAFANCTSMTKITDLDSVVTIGEEAFKACTMLKNVDFPDSLKTISNSAFQECVRLKSVSFGNQIELIGSRAFYQCKALQGVEIPDGAPTHILDEAFYECEDFGYVRLGNEVLSIGASAFSSCSLTREVILGDSVVSIGAKAFASCRKIYQITLGASLISIGQDAFSKCWLLREVYNRSVLNVQPNSQDNGGVGYYAYYVRKKDEPTRISKDENGLVYYTEGAKKILIAVEYTKRMPLVVPDDVTEIAPYAGYSVQEISSVYIGDGCKKIGESAFRNTYQISEVHLGKNLEVVGDLAFRYNGYITTVVVGKRLKKIGREAFLKKAGSKDYRAYQTIYYEGTEADWANIEFYKPDLTENETDGNLEFVVAKRAYYSEDRPTTSGSYWWYKDGKPTLWS